MQLVDTLIRETNATFSDITRDLENAVWIRSTAREVDLFHELTLVENLATIMKDLQQRYHWAAVSSNNIKWNATERPIRVIQISDPLYYRNVGRTVSENLLTVVNPEIIDTWGRYHVNSGEGCGSLGEAQVLVNRHRGIKIKGYVLEEGRHREIISEIPLLTANIEHEFEHLEGKLISDKGPVLYLMQRNQVFDITQESLFGYISSLFGTKWPNNLALNKNQLIYASNYTRFIILNEFDDLIPTLSFVLKHDDENKPYWELFEKKVWAIYQEENTRFSYGKPIVFEFPDTPEFRKVIYNMPDVKSRYKFWDIPIVFEKGD